MGRAYIAFLLLLLLGSASFTYVHARAARSGHSEDGFLVMPSEKAHPGSAEDEESGVRTRWAILVAGSAGYWNYRHQADICHAYQILRRGGLKDENIVVFMYDDIAHNPENPRPGVIINSPQGEDVYAGVPKDYTGEDVTAENFYAVLLGNKTAVTGGSGKVVDSGPDDHIFIFYSDHGGPGVLGMPTSFNLYADDFVASLKKKHAAGSYKEMVIYVEACESGSIFEGLLPDNMSIYVTTASNAEESSWGTYCPGMNPPPPPEFETCLGDLYSISWMEDSEMHNLKRETFKDQYQTVKTRTSDHNTYRDGSHVMEYGDGKMNLEKLYFYMGNDPANENLDSTISVSSSNPSGLQLFLEGKKSTGVNQRDADLVYFWHKYKNANEGSDEKLAAAQEMTQMMARRIHLDKSVDLVGKLLFGYEQGPAALRVVRSPGQPLVDDWACLKAMVKTFESHCGALTQYGMKHMRALANICNAGVDSGKMAMASAEACAKRNYMSWDWSPLESDFGA